MLSIEGIDKSGKSTLLNNILKIYKKIDNDIFYIHLGLPSNNWDYFENYYQHMNFNSILDRTIDSELVYGPVFRKNINTRFTKEKIRHIRRMGLRFGTTTIYCNISPKKVYKRIIKLTDKTISKKSEIEKIINQYKKLYKKNYPWNLIKISTENPIKKEIINSIIFQDIIRRKNAIKIHKLQLKGFIHQDTKNIIIHNDDKYQIDEIHEHIEKLQKNIKDYSIINKFDCSQKKINTNIIFDNINLFPELEKIFIINNIKYKILNKNKEKINENLFSNNNLLHQIKTLILK